jgi:hypothetical protein
MTTGITTALIFTTLLAGVATVKARIHTRVTFDSSSAGGGTLAGKTLDHNLPPNMGGRVIGPVFAPSSAWCGSFCASQPSTGSCDANVNSSFSDDCPARSESCVAFSFCETNRKCTVFLNVSWAPDFSAVFGNATVTLRSEQGCTTFLNVTEGNSAND